MCYLVFTLLLLHKRRVYHETHVYFFESDLPAEHRPFMYSGTVYRLCFFRTFDSRCRFTGSCNSFPISRHIKNWRFFYSCGDCKQRQVGSVASVNTYGRVTAKKAGTCTITGKVAGGEASCKITVTKTIITLSTASITMENGAQVTLKGQTSNRSPISWKSQKSSVAEIDENGKISAKKPGETTITAKADGTKKTCHVTVKKPKVTLNYTSASLSRNQTLLLTAKVSSGKKATWKSQKKSVATVNSRGKVTAIKRGTTKIRASIDGVTKECTITVL